MNMGNGTEPWGRVKIEARAFVVFEKCIQMISIRAKKAAIS